MDSREHPLLIFGSTGRTGRCLLDLVAQRELAAVAHVRPGHGDLAAWRQRLEILELGILTTPFRQSALVDAFQRLQPSHLFNLLGSSPARLAPVDGKPPNPFEEGYQAVDVGLTGMLVRACAVLESPPRMLMVSSLEADRRSRCPFHAAKGVAEEFLIESGVPYTIVRVGGLVEDDEGPRCPRGVLQVTAGLLSERRERRVHAADLAETLLELALDRGAMGRLYEVDA